MVLDDMNSYHCMLLVLVTTTGENPADSNS